MRKIRAVSDGSDSINRTMSRAAECSCPVNSSTRTATVGNVGNCSSCWRIISARLSVVVVGIGLVRRIHRTERDTS